MAGTLVGSRLKLKRALEHVKAGNACTDEWKRQIKADGNQSYRLEAKFDNNLGYAPVHIVDFVPLPDDYPLIVGDAIHNLRTSLDHLAWQIVPDSFKATADERRLRYISFPISRETKIVPVKTMERWNAMVENRLPDTSPAQRAIIKSHQLFNSPLAAGQWHPLAGLRDLDDMDKHRLPISLGIQSINLRFSGATRRAFMISRIEMLTPVTIENGTEIARVHGIRRTKAQAYMQMNYDGIADVVFPDGGLIDVRYREMRIKVENIITEIEATL